MRAEIRWSLKRTLEVTMYHIRGICVLVLPMLALSVGCERSPDRFDAAPAGATLHPDSARYVLTAEPAGARHVVELRKDAKDGEEVVVVGRIGGSKQPLVKDRAAFTIVDLSLKPCDNDPNCYDFVCLGKEKVAAASAYVKVLDAQDQTLNIDTRNLFGDNQLEARVIVARGQAKRDEAGNLTIAARQLYLRPLEAPRAPEAKE